MFDKHLKKIKLKPKTIALDMNDYNKLQEIAKENKAKNKKTKTAAGLIRDAIRKYLTFSDFDYLMKYEKKKLINYFSLEEAIFTLDMISNVSYSIDSVNPKNILITNIENAILLDHADIKYNINSASFVNKLNALSETQCYIIINNCKIYTQSHTNDKECLLDVEEVKRMFYLD